MRAPAKGLWAAVLCVAALTFGPASAQAAPSDPLFLFSAPPEAPPGKGFEGPCGIAVDKNGSFYVSDYYHHAVDVFSVNRAFVTQYANVDPSDGPCGLAVDSNGQIYANAYHRAVIRLPDAIIDSSNPTGVAVDPASDYLYVNRRNAIALYDPLGNQVLFEGAPLLLGQGSLKDGYGLAVSAFPSTAGQIYVADAKDNVVKVYDLAKDKLNPTQVIDGHAIAGGGFHSLRDAALAVDRLSGVIYVTDSLHPTYTERPEATIQAFSPAGAYLGHLKFNVIDARPVGLAVDNSPGGSQGRVYVTSGNSEGAVVYGYGPGAATTSPPVCAPQGACLGPTPGLGAPTGALSSSARPSEEAGAQEEPSAQASEISQKGNLRVAVSGRLSPKRLPRQGAAPIAVTVGGEVSTTDSTLPPPLESIRIEINRHGHLDYTGLPTCEYSAIQPGSSSRALANCRSALVGKGSFAANIVLAGQAPYPTEGKLLVFNGISKGKQVLYGHIYSPRPFATSFVIVFAIKKLRHGAYGTALDAPLPLAMKAWGRLTGLEMTLSRRYRAAGERRSYLSAGCPAPKGFGSAVFPLARTSFAFEGGKRLSSALSSSCRVRG